MNGHLVASCVRDNQGGHSPGKPVKVREFKSDQGKVREMCSCLHEIWPIGSQENHLNCCHQMSDFEAKMHQIRFWLRLRPRPRWGAYSAPPDLLAGFKGAYF